MSAKLNVTEDCVRTQAVRKTKKQNKNRDFTFLQYMMQIADC